MKSEFHEQLSINYHNTTNLRGRELKKSKDKAKTQNEVILDIFKEKKKLTPSMALFRYEIETSKMFTPLTSIRRGINTLTKLEELVKTDEMTIGKYGRKEHYWMLKSEIIK